MQAPGRVTLGDQSVFTTGRQLLQAKLAHSERMATIGRLVSGVAHEVNNPLAAILGFTDYIKSFPKADLADDAQVNICSAYIQDGKNDKAVEACDLAIRTYPNGDKIPDAYYKKGLALQNLKDVNGARAAWEHVVQTAPDSDAGRLAKQRLDQIKRPN